MAFLLAGPLRRGGSSGTRRPHGTVCFFSPLWRACDAFLVLAGHRQKRRFSPATTLETGCFRAASISCTMSLVCQRKKYLASPHCVFGLTTLEWPDQIIINGGPQRVRDI